MPRIRTIKPELPQDEVVGSVSRDARLCWLLLFTVADDEGRFRSHPRLLSGQLYPYDDIGSDLVESWLAELDAAGLIRRYQVKGQVYGCIPGWQKHQKIDHPAPSRIPAPEDGEPLANPREALANPREALATDLGPRTVDLGPRTKDLGPRSIVPNGTHPTTGEPGALVAAEGAAQKVFDAWKLAAGKNGATVLNKGRLAKVKGRLAEGYPLEDLLDAVVGITEHEWHRANGQVELELALRDGQHLERFRDIHRGLLPRRDAVTEGRIDREMRAALEGGTVDVDLLRFAYPQAYEEGTSAS